MAVIVATRVGDTLTGTAGDDSITGSTGGADRIDGDLGNDTIMAGDGPGGDNLRFADTLHGGGGDDHITAKLSGLVFGDDGNDTLVTRSDFSTYTLEGGAGDDRIEGALDNNGTV